MEENVSRMRYKWKLKYVEENYMIIVDSYHYINHRTTDYLCRTLGVATIPGLPPRHAWAAEGLTHTCYILYADSPMGLAPDQLKFRDPSIGEKWTVSVDRWEKTGSHGGVPPGVNQAIPVKGNQTKEYVIRDPYNPLRPEVSAPDIISCI